MPTHAARRADAAYELAESATPRGRGLRARSTTRTSACAHAAAGSRAWHPAALDACARLLDAAPDPMHGDLTPPSTPSRDGPPRARPRALATSDHALHAQRVLRRRQPQPRFVPARLPSPRDRRRDGIARSYDFDASPETAPRRGPIRACWRRVSEPTLDDLARQSSGEPLHPQRPRRNAPACASSVVRLRLLDALLAQASSPPTRRDRGQEVREELDANATSPSPRRAARPSARAQQAPPVEVDCAARMHVCQAVCCKLDFALTRRGRERVLRWISSPVPDPARADAVRPQQRERPLRRL